MTGHQDTQEPACASANAKPVQCCVCGAWRSGALWLTLPGEAIVSCVVVVDPDGTSRTAAVSHSYCPICEASAREDALRYLASRGLKAVPDA